MDRWTLNTVAGLVIGIEASPISEGELRRQCAECSECSGGAAGPGVTVSHKLRLKQPVFSPKWRKLLRSLSRRAYRQGVTFCQGAA